MPRGTFFKLKSLHKNLPIRLLFSLSIIVSFCSAFSPIEAQDIQVSVRSINGDHERDASEFDFVITPINIEECRSDIEINLRLENIPSDQQLIDIWRSTGTACNEEGPRQDANQTGCTNVQIRGLDIAGSTTKDISLAVQDLLDCDPDDGEFSTYKIYFLATGSNGSTDTVGTGWGLTEIALDTIAPSKPSSLSVDNGENKIDVSWASSNEELRKYNLYVEQGPCNGTNLLAAASAGDPVPAGTTRYSSPAETASSASISTTNSGSLGFSLAINEQVALGITAVDQAGNESLVSVACGTRIETRGFCDEYEDCPNDCTVRAPGSTKHNVVTLLAFLVLCTLTMIHSRKKGQSS